MAVPLWRSDRTKKSGRCRELAFSRRGSNVYKKGKRSEVCITTVFSALSISVACTVVTAEPTGLSSDTSL